MTVQRIRPDAYRTTSWSGGETTELYIYPEDASFATRQFGFRLSKATVTVDASEFTPLNGVTRWLMPLTGPLKLSHQNEGQKLYEIYLEPFDVHCFRGDWSTKSVGQVTDFNLMLKGHTRGDLAVWEPERAAGVLNDSLSAEALASGALFALYVYSGALTVDGVRAEADDLLIIRLEASERRFKKMQYTKETDDVRVIVAQIVDL